MEWALFIKRQQELAWFDEHFMNWQHGDSPDPDIPCHASDISFSRTYFGNEFCEAIIPSLDELEQCLFTSLERGLSFTFVTPHVTDSYLDSLKSCFDLLSHNSEGTEVVVNDWGVLRLLRKNYSDLTPVIGRILNRSHIEYEKSNATNLTYFPYRRFLWNYGVRRVEFDCPIQVTGINLEKTGLAGSLHFPFDCCVLGGFCLIHNALIHKPENPPREEEHLRPCRDLIREFPGMESSLDQGEHSSSGPYHFIPYPNATVALERKLDGITDSIIDRLIYQSTTPM